jgi:hypothetical protein
MNRASCLLSSRATSPSANSGSTSLAGAFIPRTVRYFEAPKNTAQSSAALTAHRDRDHHRLERQRDDRVRLRLQDAERIAQDKLHAQLLHTRSGFLGDGAANPLGVLPHPFLGVVGLPANVVRCIDDLGTQAAGRGTATGWLTPSRAWRSMSWSHVVGESRALAVVDDM